MMHHERANMWSGWAVVRYRGGFAGLDWKEGLRFPIAFWGRFGWAWASSGFTIAFRLERLTPLSLKGRSRRSESKGQRVIFEGYYASLFIVECKVGLGIAGLEPATIRLKAQCSTNWAIHPKKDVVVNKDWYGKEAGPPSSHHIKGARLCMRLVLQSKRKKT